jgi:hypothetical protein
VSDYVVDCIWDFLKLHYVMRSFPWITLRIRKGDDGRLKRQSGKVGLGQSRICRNGPGVGELVEELL